MQWLYIENRYFMIYRVVQGWWSSGGVGGVDYSTNLGVVNMTL